MPRDNHNSVFIKAGQWMTAQMLRYATYRREHRTMTQIQDMIETLAAAKEAMEENPALKSQINELQDMLNQNLNAHQELSYKHNEALADREHLAANVKALEAELEAARFQELATHTRLSKLVSSLGAAVTEIGYGPVPVANEPSADVAGEHAQVQVGQSDANLQLSSVGIDNEAQPLVWDKPQVTDLNTKSAMEAQVFPVILKEGSNSEALQQFSEVDQALSDAASEMLSQPNSVVDGSKLDEGTAKAEEDFSRPEINVPEVPAPYSNKPYSFKPDAVTWPEWVAGGGKRPWWLTDDELDKLSKAVA